jgi:hypothetical protein
LVERYVLLYSSNLRNRKCEIFILKRERYTNENDWFTKSTLGVVIYSGFPEFVGIWFEIPGIPDAPVIYVAFPDMFVNPGHLCGFSTFFPRNLQNFIWFEAS